MTLKRGDMREELNYIPPPNRKLPPVPGSQYNTCDRIKRGMDDEICPYATFHLLGFREEMDPNQKNPNQFQTFPHPNGLGGAPPPDSMSHHRQGSQSMPRPVQGNRFPMRMNGAPSLYGPEYDDPANCDMENHTYASYSNTNPQLPPDFGGSPSHNAAMARRSVGSIGPVRNMMTLPPYPEPPMVPVPPPRAGNDSVNISSSSNNDSTVSAEISEAECDREHLVNRNYGGTKAALNSTTV